MRHWLTFNIALLRTVLLVCRAEDCSGSSEARFAVSDGCFSSFELAVSAALSQPCSTISYLQNTTAVLEVPMILSSELRIEGNGGSLAVETILTVEKPGLLVITKARVSVGKDSIFVIKGSLRLHQVIFQALTGLALDVQCGSVAFSFSEFTYGETLLGITGGGQVTCEHCQISGFRHHLIELYNSSSCGLRSINITESCIETVSGAVLSYVEETDYEIFVGIQHSRVGGNVESFLKGKVNQLTLEAYNTTFHGLAHVVSESVVSSTLSFTNCDIQRMSEAAFSLDALHGVLSITNCSISEVSAGPVVLIPSNPFLPSEALITITHSSIYNVTNPSLQFSAGLLFATSVTACISDCEVWGLTVLKSGLMSVTLGVAHLSNILYRDSAVSITSIMDGFASVIVAENFTVKRVQNNDAAVMATLHGTSGYWRNVTVVDSIDVSPASYFDYIILWVGFGGDYTVERSYFRNIGVQVIAMGATHSGKLTVTDSVFADLRCFRAFDVFLGGFLALHRVTFLNVSGGAIVKCGQEERCSEVSDIRLQGVVDVDVLFSLGPGRAAMTAVDISNVPIRLLRAIDGEFLATNNSFSNCDFVFCQECINSRIMVDGLTLAGIATDILFDLRFLQARVSGLKVTNAEAVQMFALAGSHLEITNSTVVDCLVNELGGLVSAEESSSVTLSQASFANISGRTSMSSGLISMRNSQLSVLECTFSSFNVTLISSSESSLEIDSSLFSNGKTSNSRSNKHCGGVLAVSNSISLQVSFSVFDKITAATGGAICLREEDKKGSTSLRDTVFHACSSHTLGGAMYIQGAEVTVVNSTFLGNTAVRGGAVYAVSASLSLSNSHFHSNAATLDGGAIQYIDTSLAPGNTTSFIRNAATYGPNLASQPSSIKRLDGPKLQVAEAPVEAASGQKVNQTLALGLFDDLGQLVSTDNSTQLRLYCTGTGEEISGSVLLFPSSGVYTASSLFIVGQPLTTVRVFGETRDFSSFVFPANLRQCAVGEYLNNSRCNLCTNNMYSFDPQVPCRLCPSTAYCSEGYKLNLFPGYWRANTLTDTIHLCLVKELCLGGFESQCAVGHRGPLCNQCASGYFKGSQTQCFQCWGTVISLSKGFLSLAIATGAVLFASAHGDHSDMMIYVTANYFLMMRVLSNMSVFWPDSIGHLLVIMGDIGSAGLTAFADTCLSGLPEIEAVYSQSLLTIVYYCALVPSLYLLAFSLKRSWFMRISPSSISFSIAVSMLPLLFQRCAELFSCYRVDGVSHLVYDPSVECWTPRHLKYAVGVALPLAIFALALPLWLLAVALRGKCCALLSFLPPWKALYIAMILTRSFAVSAFLVHSTTLAVCISASIVLLLNVAAELLLLFVPTHESSVACAVYQSTLNTTTVFAFVCLILQTTGNSGWVMQVLTYVLISLPLCFGPSLCVALRGRKKVTPQQELSLRRVLDSPQEQCSVSRVLDAPPPTGLSYSNLIK